MNIYLNSRLYQYKNTGIQIYLKSLYKKVLALDKTNHYLFLQSSDRKTLGKTKTITAFDGRIGTFLFDTLFVHNQFSSYKSDIFHGLGNILPFYKDKKTFYFLTIYDLSFFYLPQFFAKSFYYTYKYLIGNSLKNADLITTISESTKQDIIYHYHVEADKIHVIYPGIDKSFSKTKSNRLRKEQYILSLSTYLKRKNLIRALQAYAKSKIMQEYKYIICGSITNEEHAIIIQTIEQLGISNKVKVMGYVTKDELINLYTYAELFLYPSLYEGFGMPVVESLACDTIPITSNSSSLREIVTDESLLVDPYSISSIINISENILMKSSTQKKRLLSEFTRIKEKYSWEKSSDKLIRLYNSYGL